ncbi:LysR family substrate-binding domain-containing protein [Nocardia sp. NPDC004860]|uniref:LysR family substrate-binding domain-containing protein n=1 Tax=Nocardia sp. NPDC004860 TaxID=3154557 RepID=UPI0033BF4900
MNPPTPDAPSIELERLHTEQLLAVLPTAHPLAHREAVDLAALNEETFVIHPSGDRSAMYHLVLDARSRAGFSPSVLEVSETANVAISVAAGLGVALAPEPVRALGLEGIAYRPLRQRETIELFLARRETDTSPAVAAVAALVREAAAAS